MSKERGKTRKQLLAERSAQFARTHKEWSRLSHTTDYNFNAYKQALFLPLVKQMEAEGKLGRVILDAGAGRSAIEASEPQLLYPIEGKKVVRIDAGFPFPFRKLGGVLEVRADLNNLKPDSLAQKAKFARIARHLGIAPNAGKAERQVVDSLFLVDVLNYFDFRKLIGGLSQYLKPGGRLVVHNMPGRGVDTLFHPNGLKRNSQLRDALAENNFSVEHVTPVRSWLKGYGHIVEVGEKEWINLVAAKLGKRKLR